MEPIRGRSKGRQEALALKKAAERVAGAGRGGAAERRKRGSFQFSEEPQ